RHRTLIIPAPAAFLVRAGNELPIGAPVVGRGRPHRLRLRTDEAKTAIAFELAAMARIDQPIIGPRLANECVEFQASLRAYSIPGASHVPRHRRSRPRTCRAAWHSFPRAR